MLDFETISLELLLHLLILLFPLRCVSILLDADPNVINWSDYEGRTALHLAVADSASDDAAVVKALLRDRRVQVRSRN